MKQTFFRSIAWTVVATVVLILAATTGSAFAHEIQHAAHHTGGMHATSVCAWMCATAGAVTTAAHHVTAVTLNEETALPFLSGLRSFDTCSTLQARAPPILS